MKATAFSLLALLLVANVIVTAYYVVNGEYDRATFHAVVVLILMYSGDQFI